MLPTDLKPDQFSGYPPQARQIAIGQLALLRNLPLSFLPLLLREVIAYDWKFPAERKELDNQFTYLSSLSSKQLGDTMAPFAKLDLSPQLEEVDWVNLPGQFSEQLSAHLWATHQIDSFRAASIQYVHDMNARFTSEPLSIPRLAIVLVGQGVNQSSYPLFRKLRPHGVCFNNVKPENGREELFQIVAARARTHPAPFAHWYIDGARNEPLSSKGITSIEYDSLGRVRNVLIDKMRSVLQPGGAGPEALRTLFAQMRPEDLGLHGDGDQALMNRFQVSVLTEGSGTQLFSTTYVQWSAREALRRAQPLTLLARFRPRLHVQSLNEILSGAESSKVDPQGALVDADMGAYYTWINQQRLPGATQSSFLAWFEDHSEALAIGPAFPRGTQDQNPITVREILQRIG